MFEEKIMKKIYKLALLTFAFTSINVSAQEIDPELINQRSSEEINSEYEQVRNERFNNSAFKKVVKYLQWEKSKFPPKKSYSAIEEDQIKLLKCTREIIQKHKGGYEAPTVAHTIMSKAMDGDDLSSNAKVLFEALDYCEGLKHDLYHYRKKAIKKQKFINHISELPEKSIADKKIKTLIMRLYLKEKRVCQVNTLEGDIGILFATGGGLVNIKCLYSDGKVKNYIGASIKIGLGFGAMVGVASYETSSNRFVLLDVGESEVFSGFYREEVNEVDHAIIVGQAAGSRGTEVGLGSNFIKMTFGGALRFFNGATRWQTLLDPLK